MFLSLFLSVILARRFSGRKYVILTIVVMVLVSFFSAVGWITIDQRRSFYPFRIFEFDRPHPLPLSYPFYASVFYEDVIIARAPPSDAWGPIYRIDFLAFEIARGVFTLGIAPIFYSFFLLVNIVGGFVGYWMRHPRIVAYINRAIAWARGETLLFLSVSWALIGYFLSWTVAWRWGSYKPAFDVEVYTVRFLVPCLLVLFSLALFRNGKKAYKQMSNVIRSNKLGATLGLVWCVCAITLPLIIPRVMWYRYEMPAAFFEPKYLVFSPAWLPPAIASEMVDSLGLIYSHKMLLMLLVVMPVSSFTSAVISTTVAAYMEGLIRRVFKRGRQSNDARVERYSH